MAGLGVRDVRYVALGVPDMASELSFFVDDWRLRDIAAHGGFHYLAAEGSSEPFVIRLRRAAARRLDAIGLALDSRAAVLEAHARLSQAGVRLLDEPHELAAPGGGFGFHCFDLDGRTLELSADVARASARQINKGESVPVQLSHVVLHAPDVQATAAFYEQLGFRVSDWLAQFMCFLRCNEAHHRLAILPGPAALNHVAFDVLSADEMMRAIGRLAQRQIPVHWGPGRHTAGNNTFAYFNTPNGNTVEYTAELDTVDDATWQPTVYPMSPEVMDQWGTGRLIHASVHSAPSPDPGLWQAPPF